MKKFDYTVAALNKKDNRKNNIGRAWKNADGSIAVVINSFIVLEGGLDLLITLFPNKDEQ